MGDIIFVPFVMPRSCSG